jgi:Sec-independent protein translocase protein TatA
MMHPHGIELPVLVILFVIALILFGPQAFRR